MVLTFLLNGNLSYEWKAYVVSRVSFGFFNDTANNFKHITFRDRITSWIVNV